MSKPSMGEWERQVQETAASFVYPPVPDIAGAVRQRLEAKKVALGLPVRRLALALLVVLLLFASLMLVPQVRAAIFEIFKIGALTIYQTEPASNAPAATKLPAALDTPVTPPSTPLPTLALDEAILSLATPVSPAEAAQQAPGPFRLPTYPEHLGSPDEILMMPTSPLPTLISIWRDPDQPARVELALYQIGAAEFASKEIMTLLEETTVNGQPALWVRGGHLLWFQDREPEEMLLVIGNVLIWTAGEVTFRLEGAISLEEAIRMAESLQELDTR